MTDCTFFYDIHVIYLTSFLLKPIRKVRLLLLVSSFTLPCLFSFFSPFKTAPILQSKCGLYFLENISKLPLGFLIFVWDHGMCYLYHIYLCSKKSKERSKFTSSVSPSPIIIESSPH
jgi:hypothetical protein